VNKCSQNLLQMPTQLNHFQDESRLPKHLLDKVLSVKKTLFSSSSTSFYGKPTRVEPLEEVSDNLQCFFLLENRSKNIIFIPSPYKSVNGKLFFKFYGH